MLRRLFMPPVTPASLVDEFILYASSNISEATAKNHRQRLTRFLKHYGHIPLHELRPLHADEYLLSLRRANLKPDTIYGYIGTLQQFEMFWRLRYPKLVSESTFSQHVRVKRPKPRPGDKVPSPEDVAALMTAAAAMLEGSTLDIRNAAIFYTILETGLRSREVTTLTITGLRLDEPAKVDGATVYTTEPIDGKTNREPVDYTEGMAVIFRTWLQVRPIVDHDYLFVVPENCGRCGQKTEERPTRCRCVICRSWGKPIKTETVVNAMLALSRAAKLKRPIRPHAIRHFFGQRATDTNNLEVARQMLRHESIQTTIRYAHQEAGRRKAGSVRASFLAHVPDDSEYPNGQAVRG